MKNTTNRRNFLKLGLASVIGITVGKELLVKPAHASELPHLTEDDPQAKALQYVHQAADSDKHCGNCALIQGDDGDEWRPCAIFPGKAVNANGWCSAWVKKP
ncbi:high-potential iron-sulfur protein [Photobacterium sp. DA100]|uniref:high-potential iron-sulfur protein n=1 Tax=Photobacterium sp. DA100 TaxID=3027472 RepID=UPI00247A3CCE|nr:high-potential iron-sulfur protein [Photobacterium sp. DA100]WEM43708.1 high-potential iron-sulfur protein [Photobacterium sp. DA100]